ncbi:hypothetical protein KJ966_15100 [bacterium]|nr:hypothetical protein [bacterium]
MIRPLKFLLYAMMVMVGFIAMYSILNAGNPNSMLRPYFPNPQYDIYVAMISSFVVFVLGFIVFFSRDREGFRQIIQLNEKKIKAMQKKGKSDDEIAESILAAMGSRPGYRARMAKRKLTAYLSEFK